MYVKEGPAVEKRTQGKRTAERPAWESTAASHVQQDGWRDGRGQDMQGCVSHGMSFRL